MQSNTRVEGGKEPILTVGDFGTALKFAFVVFFSAWLFLTDSNSRMKFATPATASDRATFYAVCVFLFIIGYKALIRAGDAIQRNQLEEKVTHHRKQHLERIEPQLRLDRSIESEEVFFELSGVQRFEIRRTRAATLMMGTINKKVGLVRLRAGQLVIDSPDVWRQSDIGTLVAS